MNMTITQMKALNASKGFYFFERDTMRFFRSKVHTGSNWQGYFVTSEQFDDNSPRLYTIRHINAETGDVNTISKFQEYKTLQDAKQAMRLL